jgi:EpsI family protein
MQRQRWFVFLTVFALVGGSGAFLNGLQASFRLGQPGLKMTDRPVYLDEKIICTNTVDLPVRILDCSSEPLDVTSQEFNYLPKDTTYGRRRYKSRHGSIIDISIVLMGRDRTSIHKPEICLEGQGWKVDRRELVQVPISKPEPYELPVMKLTASGSGKGKNGEIESYRAVYAYWFVSEDRITARHNERMLWMAKDLLTKGVLSRWAYIAYFSICRPGEEDATFARMKDFMAASVPEFQLVHGSGGSSARADPVSGRP